MNPSFKSLSVSASNPRLVTAFPGDTDRLWQADIAVTHPDAEPEHFSSILFVESNNLAFIYGMEFEEGYPKGLREDLAQKQKAFIQMLRDATETENNSRPLARLFSGHEYRAEAKATTAYVRARDAGLSVGVGFRDKHGQYNLIAIEADESFA